jgi:hypothetical protein
VSAKQHVPASIALPPYAESGFLPDMNERIQVQDAESIVKMRAAGLLAAQVGLALFTTLFCKSKHQMMTAGMVR